MKKVLPILLLLAMLNSQATSTIPEEPPVKIGNDCQLIKNTVLDNGAQSQNFKAMNCQFEEGKVFAGNLDNSDFSGASLVKAVFKGPSKSVMYSSYKNVDFTGANLRGATFERGADFTGTDFTGAILSHHEAWGGLWNTYTKFEGAQIQNTIFTGDLTGVNFQFADVKGADFSKATNVDSTFMFKDDNTILPQDAEPDVSQEGPVDIEEMEEDVQPPANSWGDQFALVYSGPSANFSYLTFDPYDTLNIPRIASNRDIIAAYRLAARQYHPDKASNEEQRKEYELLFIALTEAQDALLNPEIRVLIDAFIDGQQADGSSDANGSSGDTDSAAAGPTRGQRVSYSKGEVDLMHRNNTFRSTQLHNATFADGSVFSDTSGGGAGQDLRNLDFSNSRLRDAWFTDANLNGANFNGADLTSAHFSGSQRDKRTTFEGAILTGASGL